jgi:FkbH-like protein
VLGLVSKNEESTALEAIRKHPAMVLREEDFVAHRINWQDKARNVADLAAELNLGLQSVVFIDDNPVERARVREALPEVLVPEWPADALRYPQALLELDCFDIPSVTEEDLRRSEMYRTERARSAAQADVGSLDDWLMSLGTVVRAEPLGPATIVRATQLLNKTNQMNLSTRRMTEQELLAWSQEPGHALWTISVSDRFGHAGLTGLLSLDVDGETGRLVDYVLSCRVMGRKVEEAVLHVAVAEAARRGVRVLQARYVPTAKNAPCLGFLRQSDLREQGDVFEWDVAQSFPLPPSVTLEVAP